MVTGTSVHSSKEALRLTRLYPNTLYSTAGVHPHDAKSWEDDTYRSTLYLVIQRKI
jgi:TatD DNase family protein